MRAVKDPAREAVGEDAQVAICVDVPSSVVSVEGQLSAATVAELRSVLVAAADHGSGDLVLDLGGVRIVDATGLGVLVGAHRLAERRERRLVLRNVPDRVERLLAATRLNRILAVEAVSG